MNCPICSQLYIAPRLYACGHTVCALCMVKNDLSAIDESCANHFPRFTCPICRHPTLISALNRPLNISLIEIIEEDPNYETREKEVRMEMDEIMAENRRILDDVSYDESGEENLAKIAVTERSKRALDSFDELLPIIKKAAYRGQKMIVFNSVFAKNLSEISDEIAKLLFKTGIHSIIATPREFTINILKDSGRNHYSGEFINPDYTEDDFEI